MRKIILIIAILSLSILITNCGGFQTRTETDHYSITVKDTTKLFEQLNAPGNRDNGIVYPSSRTIKAERYTVLKDSIVERHYPNFIRLGAFESVGLIGSSSAENSGYYGIFGLFPNLNHYNIQDRGSSSGLFQGLIYRFGIGEWRLRWFRDAKNWTYGTYGVELIKPDALIEKTLIGVFPLYIKKRWYLREEIPYVSLSSSFGIGYYPSQYINLSGAIEVGSIGGLNIRGYLGFAAGINSKASSQVSWSNSTSEAQTPAFPYAGIGISFLDFHNLVPETLKEWKDHEHSSWRVGLLQMALLTSTAENGFLNDSATNGSNLINGFSFKLANAEVILPILDNKFYLGASALNLISLGKNEWGFSILPIRLGYFTTILADELSLEPFFEYNYFPSNFINTGAKLNLRITDMLNIGLIAGFASGNSNFLIGQDLPDEFKNPISFSRPYIGFAIGFVDRIFYPNEIRYNK